MLGSGRDLEVGSLGLSVGRLALVAVDERAPQLRGQVWVLAERLVGSAPPRVAVHVHRRCPERQRPVIVLRGADVVLAHAPKGLVQKPPRLVRDRRRLRVDERRVPGHRRGEVGRKARRVNPTADAAGVGVRAKRIDPVLPLAPIGVLLHTKARDRRGAVRAQLRDLLRKRHARDQVGGALLEGVGGVHVYRRARRCLRQSRGRAEGAGEQERSSQREQQHHPPRRAPVLGMDPERRHRRAQRLILNVAVAGLASVAGSPTVAVST